LKETFTNNQIASAYPEQNTNPESARVRRSVAMLGLAISIGVPGFLASTTKSAQAANSASPEWEVIDLPQKQNDSQKEIKKPQIVQSQALAQVKFIATSIVDHHVKPGESLWSLAHTYQTTPSAIATTNNLLPESDLIIGQTLKIPTPEQLPLANPEAIPEQLDSSSANLRQTRKRLQESLAALRTQEAPNQANSEETVIVTETTALVPDNSETSVEIPVISPGESPQVASQSIPIPVPTPESDRQISGMTATTPSLKKPEVPSIAWRKVEPVPEVPVIPAPRVIVTPENKVYRVRPGDTLNTIARYLGITPAELARENGIDNPHRIKVNQTLVVPDRSSNPRVNQNQNLTPLVSDRPRLSFNPTVPENLPSEPEIQPTEDNQENITGTYQERLRQDVANLRGSNPSETQKSIAIPVNNASEASNQPITPNPQWTGIRSRPNQSAPEQIIGSAPTNVEEYNDRLRIPVGETVEPSLPPLSNPDEYLPNPTPIFTGFIWPTRGVLTSGFGWRWGRPHRGIDIAGPIGTPVVAAASGEVISSGWNSGGYGNLVKLRHADGSITLYAHNSRLLVRRGQTVQQGEPIAQMGSTGFSTGPHLHFEIHPSGRGAVNPMAFLPGRR
jgi:murein DD-endopeptidase MepM/ murein hydrolase activator NlpD